MFLPSRFESTGIEQMFRIEKSIERETDNLELEGRITKPPVLWSVSSLTVNKKQYRVTSIVANKATPLEWISTIVFVVNNCSNYDMLGFRTIGDCNGQNLSRRA